MVNVVVPVEVYDVVAEVVCEELADVVAEDVGVDVGDWVAEVEGVDVAVDVGVDREHSLNVPSTKEDTALLRMLTAWSQFEPTFIAPPIVHDTSYSDDPLPVYLPSMPAMWAAIAEQLPLSCSTNAPSPTCSPHSRESSASAVQMFSTSDTNPACTLHVAAGAVTKESPEKSAHTNWPC